MKMPNFVLLLAGVLLAAVVGAQHAPTSGKQQHPNCQQMMSRMHAHMADMKAMDAEIKSKAAAMNAAQGDRKVDAMAEVINEMVDQRLKMHEKMMSMRNEMMSHMGRHAAQGGGDMANCPMMKSQPGSRP
jgi:gas vesicle protein